MMFVWGVLTGLVIIAGAKARKWNKARRARLAAFDKAWDDAHRKGPVL